MVSWNSPPGNMSITIEFSILILILISILIPISNKELGFIACKVYSHNLWFWNYFPSRVEMTQIIWFVCDLYKTCQKRVRKSEINFAIIVKNIYLLECSILPRPFDEATSILSKILNMAIFAKVRPSRFFFFSPHLTAQNPASTL